MRTRRLGSYQRAAVRDVRLHAAVFLQAASPATPRDHHIFVLHHLTQHIAAFTAVAGSAADVTSRGGIG